MTSRAPDAGWCLGYRRASPHWSDLLLTANDGRALCQTCQAAWLRSDTKGNP